MPSGVEAAAMTAPRGGRFDLPRDPDARVPVIPSAVLGMVIFVAAEVMFFAGLVSAYVIGRAGAIGWPPPGQPRLPVALTAANTAVLLTSGILLYLAERSYADPFASRRTRRLLTLAWGAGAVFVLVQGSEWARLVGFGLTMTSSAYGSFFYLVVGGHALHALGGLLALGHAALRLRRETLTREAFWAVQIFWYFVVGLWPVLYVVVYLR